MTRPHPDSFRPAPLALLIAALFLPGPARPQVVADPTAGPQQRPVIHSTANGLPQVDISAPTAAGVSVNRFAQFDVDAAGAIVNNGRTASATALAGWVAANPALLASPARVIVGDVRGPLSQLNGFVEIAGPPADFILANPAGITCDGCGFLNAQRVELATGTPLWGAAAVAGHVPGTVLGTVPGTVPGGPAAYLLGPGTVHIDGAGLDARTTHAAALLTQAATINAGLWAQHLQMTLGTPAPGAAASATASSTSSSTVTPPTFALDLSALGLVSARGITLVGTAEGLGARNFGIIAAAEQLVLQLDGQLVNAGTLDAPQLTLAARQGIDNLAHGRLLGQQVALATERLANAGHPDAAPVIAATERLDLGVRQLENTDGALIFSGGEMAIGGALDEQGRAHGPAETVLNRAATVEALGDLQIATASLHNVNGGVVIDEQLQSGPTRLSLLQPEGSSERYLRELFRFEGWSRAGQYRWKTDARQITDGVLGQTPMAPVADETCIGEGEAEVCTPVRGLDYPASDPAWGYFGLTPPDLEPPSPGSAPVEPTIMAPSPLPDDLPADDPARAAHAHQQAQYDQAWATYQAQQVRYTQAVAAFDGWQTATDTRYEALDAAIAAYNASFQQQLIRSWTQFEVTRNEYASVVAASAPGRIIAGGDVTLEGATLINDRSQIIAGGHLAGTLANLTQIDALGTHRVTETGTSQYTASRWRGGLKRYHQRDWGPVLPYAPADVLTTIVLPVMVTREHAAAGERGTPALDAATERLTAEGNALWQVNPAPGSGPLFVTDTRFTRYRDWMSSAYMLEQLQADPVRLAQRLGDGFIEQRLVREQIAQLTGRRWLPGQTDDEAQYAALLNSGVQHAQALQLRPGVALSAEQVARLTSDLVWLIEREVTLADGRVQRVLVPQVYLRPRPGDLQADGTLIAGQTVDLLVSDVLENAGTIAAQEALTMDAGTLHHSGTLAGATVTARTDGDLVIDGGQVTAREAATLAAGQDLVLQSTTTTTERTLRTRSASRFMPRTSRSTAERTTLDRVAQVHVGGNSDSQSGSGALQLVAARDVVMNAAQVTHVGPGPTVIAAGRDLQLGTIRTDARVAAEGHDARNFLRERQTADVGTQIRTQGDVILAAGQDVHAKAATVASQQGALTVAAGRDVQLTAGEQTREQAQGSFFKHRSTFGSTRSTRRSEFEHTDVLGSALSTASVTIDAGRDVALSASQVVADSRVAMTAGEDLNLGTATATTRQSDFRQTTRSGIMGSGGIGVTIGRQRVTGETETVTATDVGATVGSLAGDVTLAAGTTLTHTGSQVLAPQGDIVMTAPSIDIEAGTRQQTATQRQEVKQSGLTVAVSNPVIAAAQTAQQMVQAASRTPDARMQALAAANTAMAAADAYAAVQAGQGTTIDGQPNQIATGTDAAGKTTHRDANAFDKFGGVQVTLSVGSSRSSQQTTMTTTEALPSTVAAGGDVTIAAIAPIGTRSHGDNAGRNNEGSDGESDDKRNGELTVRGSHITAGDTARLISSGDVLLEAAANTQTQQSTNRSSSASLGVVIDSRQPGFGVQVAGSRGRGHADGASQIWTEATVQAGARAQLASGADTTLAGALVTAPQVTAAVGGDLTITSLQDTDTYTSRQQQAGGSLTLGAAPSANVNASGSRIDSRYASVNEVSGIKAGDAGFDVTVQGNASLAGSVIASTDAAVEAAVDTPRNRLQVGGSTTTTDIANGARFSASGYGVNVGTAVSPSGGWVPGGTGVGIGSDGNAIDSITRAGISGIAGDTTVRSGDANTPLATIFDANRVQNAINAQVQITQEFSARAPRAVAAYADRQVKAIDAQLQQLPADGDDTRRAQLLAEKQQWVEGGAYRVLMHTATGALKGNVAGAAGAAAAATAAPLLNDWQASMAKVLTEAGMNATLAQGVAAQVSGLAAAGLGAAAGGVTGAGTALGIDANNRQLHPTEKARIKELAGKDAEKEARLTAAACAMVHCYVEYPVDSKSYQELKQLADIGASETFASERQQLASQPGMFGYTTSGLLSDTNKDALKQLNNTYQIDTRAIGAGKAVAGGLGVAASVASAPASCATSIGCAANVVVGTTSLDILYSGTRQIISGNPEETYLNNGLQALGLSPQAAAIVEAVVVVGGAATAGAVANKSIDQSIAISKLSAASYDNFATSGIKVTPEVMQSPQAQALMSEIRAANPQLSQSAIERFAKEYFESGSNLPQASIASPGATLIKVVPKGDNVSPYSGYWMSPQQAKAIATMSPEQAGQILGLPAAQAAKIQQSGMDFYAISPKPGTTPKVFVSEVASTSQGGATMPGGAQQVIVPNRRQWTTPIRVDPLTLRPMER